MIGVARLIDDEFILVGPGGLPWDKPTAIAPWAREHGPDIDVSHERADASVCIYGDVGIVSAVIADHVRAGADHHAWARAHVRRVAPIRRLVDAHRVTCRRRSTLRTTTRHSPDSAKPTTSEVAQG